jgi:phosphonate transport system permease protein
VTRPTLPTAEVRPVAVPPARGPGWTPRRRVAVAAVAALAWAVGRAGVGDEVVNADGWHAFSRFWTALADLELAGDFVRLTIEAAGVTLAYAVLGTTLSLLLGAAGALTLSELLTERTARWRVARFLAAVPRAVHEILWALLLVQVLGFDPLVAVLAIGVPFGAVTAKVFAETIDEADPDPYRLLRSTGGGRLSSLAYGVLPEVRGDLASYAFYRFECAIRSAAVLGVIGAGGLGFQLDLSFESLRYGEIWTLIVALMILSGAADAWSSHVRLSRDHGTGRRTVVAAIALVVVSWRWAGVELSTLVSGRTRELTRDLIADVLPPRLGPGGWSELIGAALDTVAMSLIALTIACVGGLMFAVLSARPTGRAGRRRPQITLRRALLRAALLLCRAVPAPIWAFLAVLVLFPGQWPGAVGLGVYNLGVLGRLFAEAVEDGDPGPADALSASGATGAQAFWYGTLPVAAPRLVSLALYRWEVILRETVVVGVVGAGGLGQLVNDHLTARDFAAVSGVAMMLIALSVAVDTISARVRRVLR